MSSSRVWILLGILLLGFEPSLTAQQEQYLLPSPKHYTKLEGEFRSKTIAIEADVHAETAVALMQEKLFKVGSMYPTKLTIKLVEHIDEALLNQEEAYRLVISPKGIAIESASRAGAYRALQTLRQLIDATAGQALSACRVVDWPSWRIRGFMHDVGRTYISMEELKKQIALFARFKINVFHWHLTEHQAWRLESKVYPELNSIAATERMPGRFYTLNEARDLVQWCKQHEVLLIPEIDMPGHSSAFERAMGFGMQTPQGKEVLKVLLREVAETLDVPYIHIGTDEVEFTDPEFVPEMVAFIRSLGRKVISWNPGWQYKAGEIDMTQLWSYRGKAQHSIPAIDSRLHYLNHYDLFADPIALFGSRILRQDEGSPDHAGAIVAIWNDRFAPDERGITAQNNLYASTLALAERAWVGGGYGYFDRASSILESRELPLYKAFADFERRLLWYKRRYFAQEPFPYVAQTQASWVIVDPISNQGDLAKVFPIETQYLSDIRSGRLAPPRQRPSYTYEGRTYGSRSYQGSGFYLRHVWGKRIMPGVYEHPEEQHTAYAMAWVHSPKAQTAGLIFETQNYSRSEPDLPPPLGHWDYRQSRIWINGTSIPAPKWTSVHTEASLETPLGNENATARPPIPVQLRAGWNRVLVKLPVDCFGTPETRLVKWMFTASLVSLETGEALPLRYHTF
ncbi:family 20 glycosylhydrolase [Porphyromonas sp. COT-290 OH3588]|uniref:family 20 glycosylhydrolase n=1 Tax=Porphyromonas sp. COT-290 OH3588 TaxID=1515617 RepID=UPI00052B8E80|nr:family 20 glycosylhydrolase [Porphyromonas sp. COT-290 OH3588]KGN97177.1 beta-N-acetylhexosaminidase [Porphyromonas sp. COT-290 OH3588]